MANKEQLKIFQQGVDAWNKWRIEHPKAEIDLRGAIMENAELNSVNLSNADLRGVYLHGADLTDAILQRANLRGGKYNKAILRDADLRYANLSGIISSFYEVDFTDANLRDANLYNAYLYAANLSRAHLSGADLRNADLRDVNFSDADLSGTDFRGADLSNVHLVGANIKKATIADCRIYGISAWGLKDKETAIQKNLTITPYNEPAITVDDLEVAQFIYILLFNDKIRHVIDTITAKVVLVLGRFRPERKAVLDAIKDELRMRDYTPVLFDFEKPASLDLTETISILAHMARFIIADITDAKSIPAELQCIVPNLPSVPVMPLVLRSDRGYALFEHIRRYNSVLEPYQYESQAELLASIGEKVIAPAESKVKELRN